MNLGCNKPDRVQVLNEIDMLFRNFGQEAYRSGGIGENVTQTEAAWHTT